MYYMSSSLQTYLDVLFEHQNHHKFYIYQVLFQVCILIHYMFNIYILFRNQLSILSQYYLCTAFYTLIKAKSQLHNGFLKSFIMISLCKLCSFKEIFKYFLKALLSKSSKSFEYIFMIIILFSRLTLSSITSLVINLSLVCV